MQMGLSAGADMATGIAMGKSKLSFNVTLRRCM